MNVSVLDCFAEVDLLPSTPAGWLMRDLRSLLGAVGEFQRSTRPGSRLDWARIATMLAPDLDKTPYELQIRYKWIADKVRRRRQREVARVTVVNARPVRCTTPHSADIAATRSGSVYAVTPGRPRTRSISRPGGMLSTQRTTKARKKRSPKTAKVSGQPRTQSVKLEAFKTKPVKTESLQTKSKAIKAETVNVVRGVSMKPKAPR
ncbi:hypothetical protein SDRG_00110 [Saprolegnia diclina VS20]|uniref:Myb-like domain-containing protein n=1 Tax=Saprolegnia diclina (strain VS20) TaxID=1156394 RepID=T0SAK9_SAPDV|nr:hypothetical protein SDRG_00110 [Saprolegnia diclina VS20]EQC42373.1 hypothetical protein SDRG_00110 [Saprolegnia diclina VS20]|eukprot:XP_008603796.1 hypothetical protein SDRG_00110 [Saprolegnia diclina VS20]